MQIIGIDIGTTTISGAVLEYENEKTVKLLEAKTIENGGFMPTANEWVIIFRQFYSHMLTVCG